MSETTSSPAIRKALAKVRATHRKVTIEKCRDSLYYFIKTFWHVLEPGREMVDGWAVQAICDHLQAVTEGKIQNLIINVPPGFMKSLTSSVFWPAWEWGPRGLKSMRYLAFAYSASLTERDNDKLMQLVTSPLYQDYFGEDNEFSGGKIKVSNSNTGWKLATSLGGVGTGERGDRVILDDLNRPDKVESKKVMESITLWINETMRTRINEPEKSSIIIIQQRVAENDATGAITANDNHGYCWLRIPMRYDPQLHCSTEIGWSDPRTETGELAWPERFSRAYQDNLEKDMGPYAVAGQMQQSPAPRGGGIIKEDWWQMWPNNTSPMMNYVIASLDTAMTDKETSDYCALTVWGSFQASGAVLGDEESGYRFQAGYDFETPLINDEMGGFGALSRARERFSAVATSIPKIILVNGWKQRLSLPQLVEKVLATCIRFNVNTLVIENKTHGHAVNQLIMEYFADKPFSIVMFEPRRYGDKVARMYAVQNMFSEKMIYAPGTWTKTEDGEEIWEWKEFAAMVIREVGIFPKGKNDDVPDTVSMALKHMHERGFATRDAEVVDEIIKDSTHKGRSRPLYNV